jgi:hypothetical protein
VFGIKSASGLGYNRESRNVSTDKNHLFEKLVA